MCAKVISLSINSTDIKPKFKIVNSIARATGVLMCLSEGVSRVSDIAKRLNLNVATVHRLLKTMEMLGLVVRDSQTHQYYLGHLVAKLGANPNIAHKTLILSSFEEMNRLAEATGETVVLHILVGAQPIRLQQIVSNQDLRFTSWSKRYEPLYSGSMGKLFLSGMKEDELHMLLENMVLIPFTPHTISRKETLIKELNKIRKRGYSLSYGERDECAMGISVPINDYVFPAALTVIGTETRMKPNLDRIRQEMLESAIQITYNLISRNIIKDTRSSTVIDNKLNSEKTGYTDS